MTVAMMRPNWTALCVSMLAGLLLTLRAESEDSGCDIDIMVPRNTVYEVFLGETLQISCKVLFCGSPPTVSWYKREKTDVPVNVSRRSHIKTQWEPLGSLAGRSQLIFHNPLRQDSGLYHCKVGLTVSHNIQVIVHDGASTNVTLENGTRSTTVVPERTTHRLWMYVCLGAGTAAVVVAVIVISVVSTRARKGKSQHETQTGIQFVAFPRSGLQASPTGSGSTAPCRQSTRRKRPHSQPDELLLPSNGEQQENSCIVYAALNHQLPAGRGGQRRPKVEPSEYAAIRFKD